MKILNRTHYDSAALTKLVTECWARLVLYGNNGGPIGDWDRQRAPERWDAFHLRVSYGKRHGARTVLRLGQREIHMTLPKKHADNRQIVRSIENPLRRVLRIHLATKGTRYGKPVKSLVELDSRPWMDVLLSGALLPRATVSVEQDIAQADLQAAQRDEATLQTRYGKLQRQLAHMEQAVERKREKVNKVNMELAAAIANHRQVLEEQRSQRRNP